MSFHYKRVVREIKETEFHCDGPEHLGNRQMDFDSITVSHGYGSNRDGQTQHFCSPECLKDWVLNPRPLNYMYGDERSKDVHSFCGVNCIQDQSARPWEDNLIN